MGRLRKHLAAALVLTVSLSSAVTAEAATSGEIKSVGDWCLANELGTSKIVSKKCDSADKGQHWEHVDYDTYRKTGMWRLVAAPEWCLANVLGTEKIETKRCSQGDRGQQWYGLSERTWSLLYLLHADEWCLANNLGTTKILNKRCNYIDSSQHWQKYNGDMISLAV